MGIALMFLLALYQMQSAIHSEIIETPYNTNALVSEPEGEPAPPVPSLDDSGLIDSLLNEKPEQTELEFRYPISAIGIDYGKNSVVLRFQKNARRQRYKFDPEVEAKRRSLQDNFMHFGKRQPEQLPQEPGYGYYEPGFKRSTMDRYGRDPKQDFMRFGRDPKQDFMRFGRDPKQDFMRFGRDPKQDFMRFGRTPSDFMRFGRTPSDFMRFGRGDNFMRFGRSPHEELRSPKQDFMRFGRPDNFMRFGRSAPTDFERFGKMDANFIRFGKSVNPATTQVTTEPNQTKSQSQTKDKSGSNPVDKAMTMLFTKEQAQKSSEQMTGSGDNSDDSSVEQFYGP